MRNCINVGTWTLGTSQQQKWKPIKIKKPYQKSPEATDQFEQYDLVNQTHLSEAIIEKAPKEIKGTKIYLPYKPVVREKVESTKMRTVYDAFTESVISSPSLNECLGTR